jgi:tetratricopeptide (TPR) repeat protein
MATRGWDWRRLGRLAWLGIGIPAAAVAAVFAEPFVPVFWSFLPVRPALIVLLVALEILYVAVLAGSLLGAAVSGAVFWRARRRGTKRPMAARVLLLCAACLIGLAFAEAIAAVWRAPVRSAPSTPASDPLLPTEFAEAKADSEVTLVVLGESSAAGVPYNEWFSVGQIVAWQLGEVMPEKRFRADVLATPGDTLDGQHRKLAGIRRRPDAVIVYCGHNEFFCRIGWSWRRLYYLDDPPPPPETIDQFARRVSPLIGLIQQGADKFRIEVIPTAAFKPELVDVPAFNASEYSAILADFRRRLEAITAYTEQIGALPILVVPPANDAGFEPLRSFLAAETPRAQREAFSGDFWAARRTERSQPERGIELYRVLLAGHPAFAEAHYRLARLLERTGNWEEAYEHFLAARDLDGMPVRCLTAFQQVYRDLAASHGCPLVDGQALFHAIGSHGILNDSLFHDSVHPSLRGQIALAQEILNVIRARRSFGWPPGVPTPVIDPAACAAHFGLCTRNWEAVFRWGQKFYHLAAALRYDPGQCLANERAYREAAQRIAEGKPAEQIGWPSAGISAARPAPDSP